MTKIQKYLIQYIKYTFNQEPLPEALLHLSLDEKKAVIDYAHVQRLIPFLEKYPIFLEEDCRDYFLKKLSAYIFIDQIQSNEMGALLDAFESHGIDCVPLKGMRTKGFYPKPELRTMSDLDILYRQEQTEKLKSVMSSLGYTWGGDCQKHDIYTKNNFLVEMHKSLAGGSSFAFDYFKNTWQKVSLCAGKKHIYEMRLEDHYLFTIFHVIHHFISGGIGIRMVLDIFILSGQPQMDWDYLKQELKVLDIERFESKIRGLACAWFGGGREMGINMDKDGLLAWEDDRELENYIVSGGVYGSDDNYRLNTVVNYGSRLKFAVKVLFPPYRTVKTAYPWLKSPLLLPAAWIYGDIKFLWKRKKRSKVKVYKDRRWGREGSGARKDRIDFFRKYGL